MTNMKSYTFAMLIDKHTENFRKLAEQYPKGCCVGFACFIRVGHGASLVTPYRTKDANGVWSGVNEYSEAL